MNHEKGRTKRILIFSAIIIAVVLFSRFILPYLILWTLPFIFAFLIIEPLVKLINKKLKIPLKLASAFVVVVVIAIIVWLVVEVLGRIVEEVGSLVAQSDYISSQITNAFLRWHDLILSYTGDGFAQFIDEQLDWSNIGVAVSNYLTGYIWPTIEKLLAVAKSLPNILVFIVALLLGTYFISSDTEAIHDSAVKLIPKAAYPHLKTVKNGMSRALLAYIRAQLIMICITFTELIIGFSLIGGSVRNYTLIFALTISIIDALPILGTGTVLIPWGIGAIIAGSTKLGVYLLILYLICLLVRQLLEPRILSLQIGMHPLVTLMTMYAGLKILGFLGMILGPVIALIITKADSLRLYITGF